MEDQKAPFLFGMETANPKGQLYTCEMASHHLEVLKKGLSLANTEGG